MAPAQVGHGELTVLCWKWYMYTLKKQQKIIFLVLLPKAEFENGVYYYNNIKNIYTYIQNRFAQGGGDC